MHANLHAGSQINCTPSTQGVPPPQPHSTPHHIRKHIGRRLRHNPATLSAPTFYHPTQGICHNVQEVTTAKDKSHRRAAQ
eukprot:1139348-Pelagomonas_calceolata.AAC.3